MRRVPARDAGEIQAWLLAAVVLAFVGGIAVGLIAPWEGGSDGSSTACAEGMSLHPRQGCVEDRTACHAWLDGASDDQVACQALSEDGDGLVEINLEGNGSVQIRVFDGDGDTVTDARSALPWRDTIEVTGAPGDWTLGVSFNQAVGHGTVVLWG